MLVDRVHQHGAIVLRHQHYLIFHRNKYFIQVNWLYKNQSFEIADSVISPNLAEYFSKFKAQFFSYLFKVL
jgi:hypothetical protein